MRNFFNSLSNKIFNSLSRGKDASQTSGYKNAVSPSQTFTNINAVSPSQTSGYVNGNEGKDETLVDADETPRNIDNYFKGSSIAVKNIKEKVASSATGYSHGAFPFVTYTTPNKNKRDMKLMSKTDHTITRTNSSNLERDNLDFIYQGKNPIPHTVTTLLKIP
jgi:hypothetical protein